MEEMTHIDTHKPQRKQKVFREREAWKGLWGARGRHSGILLGKKFISKDGIYLGCDCDE